MFKSVNDNVSNDTYISNDIYISNDTYISLGTDCHPSGNFLNLGLRHTALPFDWLYTTNNNLNYVNEMIRTNFANFMADLKYNHRGKVISGFYPETEFFHHDLIQNSNYIEDFNKRTKRFMELIDNKNNRCLFFFRYRLECYNDQDNAKKLYETVLQFIDLMQNRCKYKLIIYVLNNDNEYELQHYDFFDDLLSQYEQIKIVKYIRNRSVDEIYGDKDDFLKIIKNFC
jgi:hypothetical protein